jgi:hypothetical protein
MNPLFPLREFLHAHNVQMPSVASSEAKNQLASPLNSKDLSRTGSPSPPIVNLLVKPHSFLSSNNSIQETL